MSKLASLLPEPFHITGVKKETHDTLTFELKPSNKNHTFTFEPGQFNMLYLFGAGEVPISISGDPSDDTLIHTIRTVGSVTKAIGRLKKGNTLGVRGPFGAPWAVKEIKGSDIVLIAGGVGLAPLRPALYYILSHRGEYGKVILLYGARSPDDLIYRDELERWRGRFDLYVDVTVDAAPAGWQGNVGVVTTLISRARFDPIHTTAFVCGPEIMMRFAVKEVLRCDIEKGNIFLSIERNMKCGVGICGHCQFGPNFVCKDGPVFRYDEIQSIFGKREI